MSIQPLTLENTEGAVHETLAGIKKTIGRIPNLYAVTAKAPTVLNNMLQGSQNLKSGVLDAKAAEQIAIAVAVANNCDYCLAAHTALGKMAGLNEQQLKDAQFGKANDAKTQAILDIALELNSTHGKHSADLTEVAMQAGLNETEILEVAGHVAQNILTNTINNVAQTDIDFPTVTLKNTQ